MSDAQLADANHHLAHPPMVGLVISRSLGLTVVGRLAARYGLAVRLEAREDGGVVATVELPYGLVEYPGEDAAPAAVRRLEVMAVGRRPPDPSPPYQPPGPRRRRPPAPPVEAACVADAPLGGRPRPACPAGWSPSRPTPLRRPARPGARPPRRRRPVAGPAIGDAPVAPPRPSGRRPGRAPGARAGAGRRAAPAVTAAGLVKRTPTARLGRRRRRRPATGGPSPAPPARPRRSGACSPATAPASTEAAPAPATTVPTTSRDPPTPRTKAQRNDHDRVECRRQEPELARAELRRAGARRERGRGGVLRRAPHRRVLRASTARPPTASPPSSSGLIGLAYGAAGRFGGGAVNEVIIEMENAFLFVTGISDGSCLACVAEAECDVGLVGYEMAVLVDRAGGVLTPEIRAELQAALPR